MCTFGPGVHYSVALIRGENRKRSHIISHKTKQNRLSEGPLCDSDKKPPLITVTVVQLCVMCEVCNETLNTKQSLQLSSHDASVYSVSSGSSPHSCGLDSRCRLMLVYRPTTYFHLCRVTEQSSPNKTDLKLVHWVKLFILYCCFHRRVC